MITFCCHACVIRLRVLDDGARGKLVFCPACNAATTVPYVDRVVYDDEELRAAAIEPALIVHPLPAEPPP